MHRWVSEGEKLVDARTKDGEHDSEKPHAYGINGHAGVISLGDNGPN